MSASARVRRSDPHVLCALVCPAEARRCTDAFRLTSPSQLKACNDERLRSREVHPRLVHNELVAGERLIDANAQSIGLGRFG